MPDDKNSIHQEANGIGIAQAAGPNSRAYSKIVFNTPIEKFLIAELSTAIAVQWLLMACSLTSPDTLMIVGTFTIFCFPVIFGANAIYGLVMGFQMNNTRIKILGLVSGLSCLVPLPLWLFGIYFHVLLKYYYSLLS